MRPFLPVGMLLAALLGVAACQYERPSPVGTNCVQDPNTRMVSCTNPPPVR
jgi:hypothetical protein